MLKSKQERLLFIQTLKKLQRSKAKRKLFPALFHRFADGQIPSSSRIIGCSRSDYNDESFREYIAEKLRKAVSAEHISDSKLNEFLALITYQKIDVTDEQDYESLAKVANDNNDNRVQVYYLSVGPSLFGSIIDGLKSQNLNIKSRLVVEKPLGFDLESAKQLNEMLAKAFDENRVYRIDHYLGKETVQNLMALRFANALFEPIWNSRHIDHVQITASESIGVKGRGSYYDKSGAMRDMVQNHLLQLLCLSAMEPPYSYSADSVRDEKLKVLRSLQPMSGETALANTCRGQYLGTEDKSSYLEDAGSDTSSTESYVAIKAEINNWRWSGTPFYLRTGKRLKANMTEITFVLRETPHSIFEGSATPIKPNALVIRLQPNEGIDLEIMTKDPGPGGLRFRESSLDMAIESSSGDSDFRMPDAYERLLLDVVRGDQTLFMRGDEVEAAWTWIDPIIEAWKSSGQKPESYDSASQGPTTAMELMAADNRRWRRVQ